MREEMIHFQDSFPKFTLNSIWHDLLFCHIHIFPLQGQSLPGLSSAKAMHYPSAVSAGNRSFNNRGSVGSLPANELAEGATFDPLIGRKVWTRWPEDNNFYEAVITDYNRSEVFPRHSKTFSASL